MSFIGRLEKQEFTRQRGTLNLIAAENYPSPETLRLLGSVFSTKYSEGYPGRRYYAGNIHFDTLETFVSEKALEVFDPTGEYDVNVQLLSGSPANSMVYLGMLETGDKILSMSLGDGGHLSHLHATSAFNKFFRHVSYGVTKTSNGYEIDNAEIDTIIEREKPRLVIIGFSSYPASYEFSVICKAAHRHGALVLADIAHINGLVATGLHDSPFKPGDSGADFVSMTTHKTMRGPRGALLFAKKDYIGTINKTVFPGTSGGPHMHQVAAIGQSLLEILGEEQYPDGVSFQRYSSAVVHNAKVLEHELARHGIAPVTKTATHMCLVALPENRDSLEVQQQLEACGVITNRNVIPRETKSPWRPSGLRLGTAALTSRGMNEDGFTVLGRLIADSIHGTRSQTKIKAIAKDLSSSLCWYYHLDA